MLMLKRMLMLVLVGMGMRVGMWMLEDTGGVHPHIGGYGPPVLDGQYLRGIMQPLLKRAQLENYEGAWP